MSGTLLLFLVVVWVLWRRYRKIRGIQRAQREAAWLEVLAELATEDDANVRVYDGKPPTMLL